MSVTYRVLDTQEVDRAVGFWSRVLETSEDEARRTALAFRDEPELPAQTYAAVSADGELLATVCWWRRHIRDSTGVELPVGHLFHVATAPHARHQGHATHLLSDTVTTLREQGCQWAILSARQEAVPVYQHAGWQPIPRQYWRGSVASAPNLVVQPNIVQRYDPRQEPNGWEVLAAAYTRANAQRPASLVRTSSYWQGYGAWMFAQYLDQHESVLLVVRGGGGREDVIRGYALVNFYDVGFVVNELAGDPDEPLVVTSLLQQIIDEAIRRGTPLQGQLSVAADASMLAALQQLFGTTLHSVDDHTLYGYLPFMVRSLGEASENLFTAPTACFSPLDAY